MSLPIPPVPSAPTRTGFPLSWHGAGAVLLPRSAGSGDAVAQALALEALLPLCDALEPWLGAPLRLRAPLPFAPADARAWLTVAIGRQGAEAEAELALPIPALREHRLGRIGAGWALRWPSFGCDLCVESWPTEQLPAWRIEPGAVLLLPRSFGASDVPQDVRVLAPTAALAPRPGEWQRAEGRLVLGPQEADEAPALPGWQLIVPDALRVDAGAWFAGEAARLAVTAETAELRHGSIPLASGRLLPLGRGLGLLVEHADGQRLAAAGALPESA